MGHLMKCNICHNNHRYFSTKRAILHSLCLPLGDLRVFERFMPKLNRNSDRFAQRLDTFRSYAAYLQIRLRN